MDLNNLIELVITKDITEKEFEAYINKVGYECIKIKKKNHRRIKKQLGYNFSFESGVPDFFIWNKNQRFLCEFKSKNDSLRLTQIKWLIKNKNIPFVLAYVDLKSKKINANSIIENGNNLETSIENLREFDEILDKFVSDFRVENLKEKILFFYENHIKTHHLLGSRSYKSILASIAHYYIFKENNILCTQIKLADYFDTTQATIRKNYLLIEKVLEEKQK